MRISAALQMGCIYCAQDLLSNAEVACTAIECFERTTRLHGSLISCLACKQLQPVMHVDRENSEEIMFSDDEDDQVDKGVPSLLEQSNKAHLAFCVSPSLPSRTVPVCAHPQPVRHVDEEDAEEMLFSDDSEA